MTAQSLRILDFRIENAAEQYQVEYPPPRGVRWVHAFAIGGQYAEEKKAVKFRWEQRQAKLDLTDSPEDTTETTPGVSHAAIKCICMHVHPSAEADLVVCSVCRKYSHLRCVFPEWLPSQPLPKNLGEFGCPFCRVKFLDPFTPASEILAFALAAPLPGRAKDAAVFNVNLKFQLDPAVLSAVQARQAAVALRAIAVSANAKHLVGPLWPGTVTASVNNFQDVFKILPPKFGHHRKEAVQKNIEDLARANFNEARLVCDAHVDASISEHVKYLFAVVVTSNRSVEDLVSGVRRLSTEEATVLNKQVLRALYDRYLQLQSSDLLISSNFDGDIVSTRCPLTLSAISTPVRGGLCQHLQCFDLHAYVDVNHKMRNVEKRWKCPVCNRLGKPEELVVDSVFQEACQPGQPPRRLRLLLRELDGVECSWEELPDEEPIGEESEDEDGTADECVGPADAKRPRLAAEDEHGKNKEQIVLDLE